jgi:hypothetical protein
MTQCCVLKASLQLIFAKVSLSYNKRKRRFFHAIVLSPRNRVEATNSHIEACGTGVYSKCYIAPFRTLFVIANLNCEPHFGRDRVVKAEGV